MGSYTSSLFSYQRRKTREVKVGNVGVGGSNPIRVQSMTISDTMDTEAVVKEARGLVEAGCEIVRITAPTIHHAENLKNIRARLQAEGIKVPLVADIHFTPQAAMIAADHVEKVRVNPGNYADRKLFAVKEYTDAEYEAELARMAEKFIPLVRKCKARGVAMRIGTNHGSLSDRIMNRYGDTPLGMVESALEFVRLAEAESYKDLIISMKASSPFVMIEAYRLLAQRMAELGMDYPFHLGVTEAGEGEDGRIKSAIGIGSLLEDGIGDTVRVSLTEDSIYEIPVAQALVRKFNRLQNASVAPSSEPIEISWNPMERKRRDSQAVLAEGWKLGAAATYAVVVTYPLSTSDVGGLAELEAWVKQRKADAPKMDLLFLDPPAGVSPEELDALRDKAAGLLPEIRLGLVTRDQSAAREALVVWDAARFHVSPASEDLAIKDLARLAQKNHKVLDLRFSSVEELKKRLEVLKLAAPVVLSLESRSSIADYRRAAAILDKEGVRHPLKLSIDASALEEPILEGSSALGSLLMDGLGDAVEVRGTSVEESVRLSFNILQASRLRISKAEFIACPSCGRTLFDLQTTTQRIKAKTQHLKGVKIAIMGCIVNGPGEMADADFGYVGGGPGRIHLYVGKDCVEKNIPSEIADEKLIELIKKHNRWVEAPAS
ncbi:MAG TPA: (E)-4-hydroxy-3-methylbut-2-enyl-diphosphate synthase [bacterium]|nr:(E)-4-hydroxy-3-methylbut-2-enyl-diphosphate synthase [bacterium]